MSIASTTGTVVFALWLGLIVIHFDVWHTTELLWRLVAAALVVHLFHRGHILWRLAAIVLVPALLLTYLLPRPIRQQLREWKANEVHNG